MSSIENVQNILFYSNTEFSSEESEKAKSSGYNIVYSKNKARLIDDIISSKPVAILIDGQYCEQRKMKAVFLLQKIRSVAKARPVFLVNASHVDHVDLMVEELVYAVISGLPNVARIITALDKFLDARKQGYGPGRIRNTVQVPCLLKKLGTSGLLHGNICDLSPKGMKIVLERSCEDWTAGDEIRFSIPKKSDKTLHLDGYGRLRWTEKQNADEGVGRVQLGLEFSQLPLQTLHEFLDLLNASRACA